MKYLLDNGKKTNAWYGIVENNYGLYEDKVQYCQKYNTHVWFTTFFDEHKAQRTREEAKSGRWSTHHQMIVLLTSLMVWIVLLQFFCLKTSVYFVQCCTEIQAKSLKVLMKFHCKQCLNCDIKKIKEDSEVEAKLTSTINFIDNLRLIAEVRHLPWIDYIHG